MRRTSGPLRSGWWCVADGRRVRLGAAVAMCVVVTLTGRAAAQETHGVYLRLLDAPSGNLPAVVDDVRAGLAGAGLQLLSEEQAGVSGDRCSYGAVVFSLFDPEHASALLSVAPEGAFAATVRVAVFEDEGGVHVAAANPLSIDRTVLNDEAEGGAGARLVERLRGAMASVPVGTPAEGEYGQERSEGLIGKTMGIMAGGPFPEKVKEIARVPASEVGGVAGAAARLTAIEPGGGSWKWGLRGVYQVDLPGGRAVVGITGERMEREAFDIVGEGSDTSRSAYACPGLDHAPAFPVEIVLAEEEGDVRVLLVDVMFRMKMYFEDAGKMKFAMNMRMPGSIEDEIRDKVDETLR